MTATDIHLPLQSLICDKAAAIFALAADRGILHQGISGHVHPPTNLTELTFSFEDEDTFRAWTEWLGVTVKTDAHPDIPISFGRADVALELGTVRVALTYLGPIKGDS